jgi:tetratricopeptide (TPR) repeat protein
LPEAIELYQLASELDPSFSEPCYNLGLIYKYVGQWELSFDWNRKAAQRNPQDEAAWWNLAVAATALERWKVAREAWTAFGIELPPGEGPVDLPCGKNPIRLDPETQGEVVWADRIDPARALLRNIPLPESGFRFRDLVLNDGAPVGYRRVEGREVPVFNCLQLLVASAFSTFVAEIDLGAGADCEEEIQRLVELAAGEGMAAENWSTSVRMLCTACSEGRPHEHHDGQALGGQENGSPEARPGRQRMAVAPRREEDARRLLATWCGERTDLRLVSLEKVLAAEVM